MEMDMGGGGEGRMKSEMKVKWVTACFPTIRLIKR